MARPIADGQWGHPPIEIFRGISVGICGFEARGLENARGNSEACFNIAIRPDKISNQLPINIECTYKRILPWGCGFPDQCRG
ncbi:hypothetical protein [Paracoccus sp. SM22M-07]|uniref:hypothetical protein n=1 Tax=Paracoccus sp. SM22M-07 TaxID=1520813 RepID=UPI001114BC2C|nr:hypothetical protein [Paracoccus sp. SM22M-07]